MSADTSVTPKKGGDIVEWQCDWMGRFLDKLSLSGNVLKASKAAHISSRTAYRYRLSDPQFKDAWDVALASALHGVLEPEAFRRAVDGTLKPVFYKGEQVGSVREYSDTLLIVLLKAHAPDKYRERFEQRHTGPDGGPVQISAVTEAQRLERLEALKRAAGELPQSDE